MSRKSVRILNQIIESLTENSKKNLDSLVKTREDFLKLQEKYNHNVLDTKSQNENLKKVVNILLTSTIVLTGTTIYFYFW